MKNLSRPARRSLALAAILLGLFAMYVALILLNDEFSSDIAYAKTMLSELSEGLQEKTIGVHLAEVKGPVMDQLSDTDWLTGQVDGVFPSTHIAFNTLSGARSAAPEQKQ